MLYSFEKTNGENMSRSVSIDDVSYKWDELSDEVKEGLAIIEISKNKIEELNLSLTFLRKAREAYLSELRQEISSTNSALSFGLD